MQEEIRVFAKFDHVNIVRFYNVRTENIDQE